MAYMGGILWEGGRLEGGHVGSLVKGWHMRRSQDLQWGSPKDQGEFWVGRNPKVSRLELVEESSVEES